MFFILLSIVLVDIFLLIDNIIPIVFLADTLKKPMARNIALVLGLSMGGVFRIILVFFATILFRFGNVVYVVAGLFLLYIAFKGLRLKEKEERHHEVTSPSFIGVLASIIFVDISLSFDNVAALAAISQEFIYLAIGIAIDVVLIFILSFFLELLVHRVKGLDTAAYISIVFLAIKFFLRVFNYDISNIITSAIIVAICIVTVSVIYLAGAGRKQKEMPI